jgi:hypothetical protein
MRLLVSLLALPVGNATEHPAPVNKQFRGLLWSTGSACVFAGREY